jgi:hypothetical protein
MDYYEGHHAEFNLFPSLDDFELLHSNLEHLDVEAPVNVFKTKLMSAKYESSDSEVYPSSLQKVSTERIPNILPPSLTSVNIITEPNYLKEHPLTLPGLVSYRALVCENLRFSDLPILPNLKDLVVGRNLRDEDLKRILTTNVTSLGVWNIPQESMLLLASSKLVSLYLKSIKASISLTSLPSTLKNLIIRKIDIKEGSYPELETLHVTKIDGKTFGTNVRFPSSLRRLTTSLYDWILCKGDNALITNLSLQGEDGVQEVLIADDFPPRVEILSIDAPDSAIQSIPETVRYLSFSSNKYQAFPPSLPKSLLTLKIYNLYRLPDTYMRLLPSGLRELILQDTKCSINCLKLLPKRLVRLDVELPPGEDIPWGSLPESLAIFLSTTYYEDINASNFADNKHPALWHCLTVDCVP